MRSLLGAFAVLVLLTSVVYASEPACKDPPFEAVARSVYRIERVLAANEIYTDPETMTRVSAIRGTAWFVAPNILATIEHIPTSARMGDEWKEITLSWSDEKDQPVNHSFKTKAHFKEIIAGDQQIEYIALLELKASPPGSTIATVRASPLARNESVVGVGYKESRMRFADGRLAFPEPSDVGATQKVMIPLFYLPFEIYETDQSRPDRYVFDHEASGAPLFDCNREVVAVVQGLTTRMVNFGSLVRVTSAWGLANQTATSAIPLASWQVMERRTRRPAWRKE